MMMVLIAIISLCLFFQYSFVIMTMLMEGEYRPEYKLIPNRKTLILALIPFCWTVLLCKFFFGGFKTILESFKKVWDNTKEV